jgi:hypothetical protein
MTMDAKWAQHFIFDNLAYHPLNNTSTTMKCKPLNSQTLNILSLLQLLWIHLFFQLHFFHHTSHYSSNCIELSFESPKVKGGTQFYSKNLVFKPPWSLTFHLSFLHVSYFLWKPLEKPKNTKSLTKHIEWN